MDDAAAYRRTSLTRWAGAAGGWAANRARVQDAAGPVSAWLVEAIAPQPGHRLLELGAGVGDTGFLAAELVRPGGTLICSDVVDEMLAAARARAAELGVDNVEFRRLDAEWIDLPAASLDGVLARWTYMFVADPGAALRETRRVLRPGGRVALAAWTAPEDNPWTWAATSELVARGAIDAPGLDAPNMFALREPARIEALLGDAGFTDVELDEVDFAWRYADLDEWWDTQLDISTTLAGAVGALTPADRDDLRDALDARLARYVRDDGSVELPARNNVAAASA